MGVRGLTTFIKRNEYLFLKDFILNDCCLVIDGHSLSAQLYKEVSFYSALGGDYDKYALHVKKFFKNLKKCNIKCYVLFDGSVENRKIGTTLKRLRSKLHGASHLHPANLNSFQIFPLLMRDVFKEMLKDLDIEFTVCEFEADDEIAALAKHLGCPVLSYDSDFYIYNVTYISYLSLDSKPIALNLESDTANKYGLSCRAYKVEYFCNHFEGFNEELLPLLATLAGNDYVKKKIFKNFYRHLKIPKTKKCKSESMRTIQGLIDFLSNESLKSAVEKVLGRLKKKYKVHALNVIEKSCQAYKAATCSSIKYFKIDSNAEANENNIFEELHCSSATTQSGDEESSDSDSESDNPDTENPSKNQSDFNLPEEIITGIRNCTIQQPYINLYTHQLYFLIPQVEDFAQEDSFLCCLKILRFSFDLLTGFKGKDLLYFSREGSQYKRIMITCEESFCNTYPNTHLWDESHNYFVYFIQQTLTIDYKLVLELPENTQVFFLALLWWAKTCSITYSHLYSVILSTVMLGAIDDRTGHYRGDFIFQKKYRSKINELKRRTFSEFNERGIEYYLDKEKVNYEDSLVAAGALLKNFEIEENKNTSKLFNKTKIHKFSQFQCCLQQWNYLNALCGFKAKPTKIYKTYNGTFTYNTFLMLENKKEPMAHLESHLKGAFTVLRHFAALCIKFQEFCSVSEIKIEQTVTRKRRHRKRSQNDEVFEFEVNI